ncbi:MAG: CRISPR-associated endonuclease Cas2 [Candidatus Levybacteria bacterium RIFCSPLOWO2_01_FULL_37_26]|nr:MAG: CRISPR-associated endonuclease Cas2 [Candidatus Levybacteria bacterium RIFCSPLOWO2_01_FULL_37_26]
MSRIRERAVIGGLTKALLLTLGTGVVIGTALVFPGVGLLYKEFKKQQWEDAKSRGVLRSTIKRLERQKLISWGEKNGELQLMLEEKGRKRILQYKMDTLVLKNTGRWDGLWRVVIFDIPEDNRKAREFFREKLKNLGFQQLQKSVFITRLECKDEIDFLRHSLEISPYVSYILAKDISSIEKRI